MRVSITRVRTIKRVGAEQSRAQSDVNVYVAMYWGDIVTV
jgi:hypothetical protein